MVRDKCCGSLRDDRGYGLFLDMLGFLDFVVTGTLDLPAEAVGLESTWRLFRLARRFIQLAKGLRRP